MDVILTKLLIIKSVSEIQCLIRWFLLLFYVGSSHLRVAVCWNIHLQRFSVTRFAATFGWLCVETMLRAFGLSNCLAATFGWLCVETQVRLACLAFMLGSHLRVAVCWNMHLQRFSVTRFDAATFGWLCVETSFYWLDWIQKTAATFGWLCVETEIGQNNRQGFSSSHLRVAVCWN